MINLINTLNKMINFDKENLTKVYYLYVIFAIMSAIFFIYLKCRLYLTYFDKFLYKSDKNYLEYVGFHIITYGTLGIIFGFTDYILMFLKTIIVELCISFVANCDFNKINVEQTIYSIILSIISFTLGCLINYFFLSKKS
jgi:hypothetical protein